MTNRQKAKPMRKLEHRRAAITTTRTGNTLAGVAVPYGEFSHVLHDRPRAYRERFTRGAMNPNPETVMLYGHDPSGVPLGRVAAGSLRFQDTPAGLMFEVDLPESRADLREALERGDLSGAVSVGFYVEADGDEWQNKTNPAVRTVRSAELVELSIVQQGAYENAAGELK